MGKWRSYLHSTFNNCNSRKNLEHTFLILRVGGDTETTEATPGHREVRAEIHQAFQDVKTNIDAVIRHFESTFNALMATMNIIESDKAIKEAEYASNLTQLAFFFIPLSLVAGVCGMNLAVSTYLTLLVNVVCW